MSNDTHQGLATLTADLDFELVECTASLGETSSGKDEPIEEIRQTVCAFANDVGEHGRPGVILIGVRDDGTPSEAPITDHLIRHLADIGIDGHVLPPPTMSVERRVLAGHDVAVITVQPSNATPVRARGRIWIRVGRRSAVATAQDEKVLINRRRHLDSPFDVFPIHHASLEDLHLRRFDEEYLPNELDSGTAAEGTRTPEERLAAARMILSADEPVPTVVGMLVIGRDPQYYLPGAYIQFLRIGGTELSDPVLDEVRCTGHIARQLDRLILKLESHNRTSVDITSAPREIRRSLYAPAALRQIACNAVMHRSYEGTNAPVRVIWFDDRIEFISPGEPYRSVTIENIGQPDVTDYRNPSLAAAMCVLRIVYRFGNGIGIARESLHRNEQEGPEFEVMPNFLRCTIRARESITPSHLEM